MGKKHRLSHLVADLTTTSNASSGRAAKSENSSSAASSALPPPRAVNSKFRKHDDFSSSSEDEDENSNKAHPSGKSALQSSYVAMPSNNSTNTNIATTTAKKNAAPAAASKRDRDGEKKNEDAEAQKKSNKVAVVETLTIGGKKIVSKTTPATGGDDATSSDDDDDFDDISIDSFDAEEMQNESKKLGSSKKNTKKEPITNNNEKNDKAAANDANSKAESDEEEADDDEEFEEGMFEEEEGSAGSWNDEDLEALMAMGGESDEENEDEEGADEEEEYGDDEEEEDDDEDDDDYKTVANELAKAKKVKSSSSDEGAKNPNPNKKDESVVVNFDAFGFEDKDVDQTIHLMDNFVPDKMNEVDRDEFAAILMAEPTTMIIKQGERESDEDDDEDDDDSDHDDGIESDDADGENTAATALNDDVEDVFAIYSLLPVTSSMLASVENDNKAKTASVAKALGSVLSAPWAVMQRAPTSVAGLLLSASSTNKKENNKDTSSSDASCPATLLLVMDHIKTVPIDVTIAAMDNIIADAEGDSSADEARYTPKQLANLKIVCLAKIQRNAEKDNAKNKRGAGTSDGTKVPGTPGENNNKRRNALISSSKVDKSDLILENNNELLSKESLFTEAMGFEEAAATYADADRKAKEEKRQIKAAVAAENNGFQLSDYVFWRPFEEALYDRRDTTVSVHAIKCRAQYDEQPDNDRPITVAFAVTWNGLKSAVAAVRNLAIPTAPGFF